MFMCVRLFPVPRSDGDDDGTSSFVSMRDDVSDAGSVMSGYTSVSAGGRMEGGRYVDARMWMCFREIV